MDLCTIKATAHKQTTVWLMFHHFQYPHLFVQGKSWHRDSAQMSDFLFSVFIHHFWNRWQNNCIVVDKHHCTFITDCSVCLLFHKRNGWKLWSCKICCDIIAPPAGYNWGCTMYINLNINKCWQIFSAHTVYSAFLLWNMSRESPHTQTS